MADAGGIRAGRAYVELGVNDRIAAGLAKARTRLLGFGRSLRSFGSDLSAVSASAFAGGAVATGALAAAVRSFVGQGSDLQDMSQRTGMSVETLSELSYAAEQTGSSLGAVEKAARKMQRAIYDADNGSKSMVDALADLGLKADDLKGQTPEAQFEHLTSALARVEDPSQRAALALTLFGRAGTELLPMLDDANGGLDALRAAARDLGVTISGPSAAAADALGDAFTDVARVAKAAAFAIGAALSPAVLNVVKSLTAYSVRVVKWVQDNRAIVVAAGIGAAAFTGIAGAIMSVGIALIATAPVFSLMASGVGLVASAFLALTSPIGIAVAAVTGAVAAFAKFTTAGQSSVAWVGQSLGWLANVAREKFGGIARVAIDAWGGIADALTSGEIVMAAEVLWAGLKVVWENGRVALLNVWDSFKVTLQVAWLDLGGKLEGVFIGVTSSIAVAWHNLVSFLRTVWQGFSEWHANSVETLAGWIAKRWLEVQGVLDPSLNVDAAKESVDQQVRQRRDEIASAGDSERAAIAADRQAALDVASAERAMSLRELAESQSAAEAALVEASSARTGAAASDLTEAEARLRYAIAQAKLLRESAEGWARVEGNAAALLPQMNDVEAAASRFSVQGTFLASSVSGLGAGGPLDRIARASERTANAAERTATKIEVVMESDA